MTNDCFNFINAFKCTHSTHAPQPFTMKECKIWKQMQEYDTYSELLTNI